MTAVQHRTDTSARRATPPRHLAPQPARLQVVPPARPHRVPLVVGLVAVSLLVVAFGFAAFHSQMAATQYEIERVERELRLESERLSDLQFQLETNNSPASVERWARGVFGLVDPDAPIDLVVSDATLAEITTAGGR